MFTISTKTKSWLLGGLSIAAAVVLAQLIVAQAHALEIENEDDEEYTAQVIEGDNTRTIVIAAKAKMDAQCEDACTVSIENVGEYEAQSGDVIKIKGGQITN